MSRFGRPFGNQQMSDQLPAAHLKDSPEQKRPVGEGS